MHFKSKLYREEIKHYSLLAVLFIWGSITSYFAVQNRDHFTLIAVEENATRVVAEKNEVLEKKETLNFLKYFLENYYSYDEKTAAERFRKASDLMSEELWNKQRTKSAMIIEKLKLEVLVQDFEIESLDQLEKEKFEATLKIRDRVRGLDQVTTLKILIEIQIIDRSVSNPWGKQVIKLEESGV